jgi:peptidyl-prolyl cis-trans isomerase C
MKSFLIAVLAVLSILTACTKVTEEKKAAKTGEYVAKVGQEVITKDDVLKRLEAIPDYLKSTYEGEEGMKRAVDELVKTDLLYLQAKKEGLDKDQDYLSKVEDYKKFALVSLLFDREMKKFSGGIKITDEDAKSFYEKNKDKFKKEGKTVEFTKVKDLIIQKLEQDKQRESFEGYLEKLKSSYPVTINENKVKELGSLPLAGGEKKSAQ